MYIARNTMGLENTALSLLFFRVVTCVMSRAIFIFSLRARRASLFVFKFYKSLFKR